MTAVMRLVTFVEVRDDAADARQMSVSARHEAVLADGRHLLLLEDRGWTSSQAIFRLEGGACDASSWGQDVPNIWAMTSVEEIENTARMVVGPDEPFDGRSQEDMEAAHWVFLAEVLRQQGVIVAPAELRRLPHDVVLGERLLARVDQRFGA
jgi:hypothetical protein